MKYSGDTRSRSNISQQQVDLSSSPLRYSSGIISSESVQSQINLYRSANTYVYGAVDSAR